MAEQDATTKFEVNLFNYFNAQYVGHLYIGGKKGSNEDLQRMRIIYDTGSHWTWVQSENCKGLGMGRKGPLCTMVDQGYDERMSEFTKTKKEVVYLNYGQGYAEGFLIKDRICLDSEAQSCSNQYKMLDVYKTRQLGNVRAAGLVGLSPASDSRCKRFMDDLKE